jgi:hypothetical protein
VGVALDRVPVHGVLDGLSSPRHFTSAGGHVHYVGRWLGSYAGLGCSPGPFLLASIVVTVDPCSRVSDSLRGFHHRSSQGIRTRHTLVPALPVLTAPRIASGTSTYRGDLDLTRVRGRPSD